MIQAEGGRVACARGRCLSEERAILRKRGLFLRSENGVIARGPMSYCNGQNGETASLLPVAPNVVPVTENFFPETASLFSLRPIAAASAERA